MTPRVTPAMANDPDPDENIFAAALQWDDPAERAAYLDEACAGRPDLRARVEALLLASSEAQTFLERPVGVPRPAPGAPAPTVKLGLTDLVPDPEGPGTRIGRYKILQQIGEGGCGTVFMAEQEEPVRRRVALKVIKLGMDTKSVVARFEAERQALAMMDHPNIAKVLDAGATDSGRPFFVMELVRGIPITRYCDENKLDTQQRLDLFIKVCQAIQHAHQKGIIHRDIKPSNILVTLHDGVPVPKVIDFGIAKATEGRLTNATLFTAFEQFIGTPAYMSPEQAEMSGLDIDTRSDIYSLGVLLYELLTGQTPFDARELAKAGIDAMRKTIREKEPQRPSTRLSTLQGDALAATATAHGSDSAHFLRRIRGDLDWIVMKCLEKDRVRRYETANGLAADLRRHLNDEPVTARPPSTAYRFRRAVRRNKIAFAAGTAIATALLCGMALTTWQALRANREADRAVRAEADAQRRLAESEAITAFLADVFQSPAPGRDGRTVTAAEMLDRATKRLNATEQFPVEVRLHLQETLARTYLALGLHRECLPLLEKIRAHHTAQLGPSHPRTIQALDGLIEAYRLSGRYKEMLDLAESRLELCRTAFGDEHPQTISAMDDLAHACSINNKPVESVRLSEEALRLSRKCMPPECVLIYMQNLAVSYLDANRSQDAIPLLEEIRSLTRHSKGRSQISETDVIANLAACYKSMGRLTDHLRYQQEAVDLARKELGPDHPKTLRHCMVLASGYGGFGRYQEQLELLEDVVQRGQATWEPESSALRGAELQLAMAYRDLGHSQTALQILLRVEQIIQTRIKDPVAHHNALTSLADYWALMGDLDQQIRILQDQFRRGSHPSWADYVWLLVDLELRERFAEMKPILERALAQFGEEPDKMASMRSTLVLAEAASGPDGLRAPAVQAMLRDQLQKIHEEAKSASRPIESGCVRILALKALWEGHPDTHHAHSQRLLQIVANSDDAVAQALAVITVLSHPRPAPEFTDSIRTVIDQISRKEHNGQHSIYLARALYAYRNGQFAEADDLSTRCLGVSYDNNPFRARALGVRAMARWKLGKAELARQDLQELDGRLPRTRTRTDLVPMTLNDILLGACLSFEEAKALIHGSDSPTP